MTPLSGYVGYALRRAQGVIFADFNQSLAELGLRPGQFAVLMLIDRNPGTSQSNVSAALGIQKANFVATIADLEKQGYNVRIDRVGSGAFSACKVTDVRNPITTTRTDNDRPDLPETIVLNKTVNVSLDCRGG